MDRPPRQRRPWLRLGASCLVALGLGVGTLLAQHEAPAAPAAVLDLPTALSAALELQPTLAAHRASVDAAAGDQLCIETPGGGGYGDPEERRGLATPERAP